MEYDSVNDYEDDDYDYVHNVVYKVGGDFSTIGQVGGKMLEVLHQKLSSCINWRKS